MLSRLWTHVFFISFLLPALWFDCLSYSSGDKIIFDPSVDKWEGAGALGTIIAAIALILVLVSRIKVFRGNHTRDLANCFIFILIFQAVSYGFLVALYFTSYIVGSVIMNRLPNGLYLAMQALGTAFVVSSQLPIIYGLFSYVWFICGWPPIGWATYFFQKLISRNATEDRYPN